MPEAGVDLTQGVEQLGGFHYFDNKPHTGYIHRYKTQKPDRTTYRQKDRQTDKITDFRGTVPRDGLLAYSVLVHF